MKKAKSVVGKTVKRCSYLVLYFVCILVAIEEEPDPVRMILVWVCLAAIYRHAGELYVLYMNELE